MPNLQLRRGTTAAWAAANPVLLSGEMGCETDGVFGFKIGDGVKAWNALPYSSGPPGAVSGNMYQDQQGEQGDPGYGLASGTTNRAQLGPDAKGWAFLGTATGATITVGPVIWTGQFRNFKVEYVIAGYNGGTPIGRLLFGVGSISTTALTNGNKLIEDVTVNATSVSVPGCPLAITATSIARSGVAFVYGASGSLKQCVIEGMEANPAVATSPTLFSGRSFFSDLGTNLLLQRMQLTVYDTLLTTAASAQTFTAGTYLSVWGRNQD